MVKIIHNKEVVSPNNEIVADFSGVAADTKPTKYGKLKLGVGCWFLETDSKNVSFYDGTAWLFMYNMEG